MNITRFNLKKNKTKILNHLKKSDFIAFDFEMTGILSNNTLRNSNADSIQYRYWKVKNNVTEFIPIQMGICAFEKIEENSKNG
jgi:hypothetical protein